MSELVKPVYRIGDIVKIVKPEFFVRVGYPLGLCDVQEELDRCENHITDLMHKSDMPWYDSGVDYKIREGVRRALGYGILAKKNFGGRERKIFTALSPGLINRTMKVVGKKDC